MTTFTNGIYDSNNNNNAQSFSKNMDYCCHKYDIDPKEK